MYILGLTFPIGWNAAACLLHDDKLLSFVEEERLSKFRYGHRIPALEAMNWCLREAGITLDQVDHLAFGWDHGVRFFPHLELRRYLVRRYLLRLHGNEIFYRDVVYQNHHLSHVASSYYCSSFDESNFISLDSSGGDTSGILGVAQGAEIKILKKLPVRQSWGYVYESITEAIGFLPHREEGKTMGLAAYGESDLSQFTFLDFSQELPRIDLRAFKKYLRTLAYRKPGEEITDEHKCLAATVQEALEKAVLSMARWLHRQTGVSKFCLSGGCALNCSTNGLLARQDFVDDVYVQPASHDAGTSLGAALLTYKDLTGKRPHPQMDTPHFGPGYSSNDIEAAIKKTRSTNFRHCQNILEEVAKLLVQKKVVGWFQGRLEFGPRALGGRSILGNPCDPEMKDIINKQVKNREPWRPFAPSMKEEALSRYVDNVKSSPFMLKALPLKKEVQNSIPAATHVDGTVRIQAVSQKFQPKYWALCDAMEKLTGHPVVLNTSFNVAGQPIVCSPFEALATFYASGLDYLAIGDYLVWK